MILPVFLNIAEANESINNVPKGAFTSIVGPMLQRAEVFLLNPTESVDLGLKEGAGIPPLEPGIVLALPFPTCYFERLGDQALLSGSHSITNAPIHLDALLVHETSPGCYTVAAAIRRGIINTFHELVLVPIRETAPTDAAQADHPILQAGSIYATVIRAICSLIHTSTLGSERIPQGMRISRGKYSHRITRVIRMRPQSPSPAQVSLFRGTAVDWTHQWTVRGHWRRHEGIGKDRAGDYKVEGYTWVSNYTKGPDQLGLVNKSRLVSPVLPAPQ